MGNVCHESHGGPYTPFHAGQEGMGYIWKYHPPTRGWLDIMNYFIRSTTIVSNYELLDGNFSPKYYKFQEEGIMAGPELIIRIGSNPAQARSLPKIGVECRLISPEI